ncbi:phage head morphogenesis protein [Clostridium gasigenes]|uniref:phage head morphogenesis protein n=1 Tax=Clostridium gasigenes TaxID=94869 RepID=UPI001C0E35AC|nr:phage head morphogenesis protein [Clostridium gasigenes]MBU3107149.1 phage head morphogenesis protein [Clostridium gasigenes]
MDREELVQSLYDDSEEELKSVYTTQKENEAKILNQISMILLTYNIVDSVLKLTNKEKSYNYSKLSNLILNMFGKEIKSTTKGIAYILSDVTKKSFESYGLKSHKDDVLKMINGHYKGKHFSDRVWDNENQVSKMIHKEIKDFLDGKVNVNQIKNNIENQFKADKYNVKRLVDSEIGNIQSKITEKYFKDYNIKKVRYNATLCNTCDKCMNYHDKVFDIDYNSRPSLPQHPQCKCFYVQEI